MNVVGDVASQARHGACIDKCMDIHEKDDPHLLSVGLVKVPRKQEAAQTKKVLYSRALARLEGIG